MPNVYILPEYCKIRNDCKEMLKPKSMIIDRTADFIKVFRAISLGINSVMCQAAIKKFHENNDLPSEIEQIVICLGDIYEDELTDVRVQRLEETLLATVGSRRYTRAECRKRCHNFLDRF